MELIQIAAIRHANGTVTLFDCEGRRITTISAELLAGVADGKLILWGEWARAEAVSSPGYTFRVSQDKWRRKIDAMRLAWKCRGQWMQRPKDQGRTRWRGQATWDKAIPAMANKASDAKQRHVARQANPFALWAATATRNANRRCREKHGTAH